MHLQYDTINSRKKNLWDLIQKEGVLINGVRNEFRKW